MARTISWSRLKVKSSNDPHIHRERVAYVQGYLLALDDMLRDLEQYRSRLPNGKGLGDPHLTLLGFLDVILRARYVALHVEKNLLLVYQDEKVPRGKKVQASTNEAEAPRSRAEPAQQGDELPGPTEQEAASAQLAKESIFTSWKQVYEQEDWE